MSFCSRAASSFMSFCSRTAPCSLSFCSRAASSRLRSLFGGQAFLDQAGLFLGQDFGLGLGHAGAGQAFDEAVSVEGGGFHEGQVTGRWALFASQCPGAIFMRQIRTARRLPAAGMDSSFRCNDDVRNRRISAAFILSTPSFRPVEIRQHCPHQAAGLAFNPRLLSHNARQYQTK